MRDHLLIFVWYYKQWFTDGSTRLNFGCFEEWCEVSSQSIKNTVVSVLEIMQLFVCVDVYIHFWSIIVSIQHTAVTSVFLSSSVWINLIWKWQVTHRAFKITRESHITSIWYFFWQSLPRQLYLSSFIDTIQQANVRETCMISRTPS